MDTHFYIFVPVYKVEKYLPACVDSILNQTYSNYDVILVDDGSPDRCGELCDAYCASDARFHVIHKKNGGLLSARIAGNQYILQHAHPNDFLVSLDSDDLLQRNALETFNEYICREQSDLVYCRVDEFYPDGSIFPNNPPNMPVGIITDKKAFYRLVFTNWGYGAIWRKAIRVCLLSTDDYSKYYDMRIGEDWLLSIDINRKCRKASFIPNSLYLYRINSESLTNTFTFENYRANCYLIQLVWDAMQEEALWTDDDYTAYLNFCKASSRRSIWMYLKFFAPLSDKKAKIEEMMAWPINQEVLAHATRRDWDFRLIRQGNYWILHWIGLLIGFFRFIYRQAKRLKAFFISRTRKG